MGRKPIRSGRRRIPRTDLGELSTILPSIIITNVDDSISRSHLAERWSKTYVQPSPRRRLYAPATVLSTIEHLVLLDLLGAPAPRVHSFYPSTAWLFDTLISAESRLQHAGFLADSSTRRPEKKPKSFFTTRKPTDGQNVLGWIDDDHMPFLKRGVNILHLIATPFPAVWHTVKVNTIYIFLSAESLRLLAGRCHGTGSTNDAKVEPYPSCFHCRVSGPSARSTQLKGR
jgi:Peptidase family M28